jgi:putative addiction module killer protein
MEGSVGFKAENEGIGETEQRSKRKFRRASFLGDGVSELKFKDGIRIYYAEIGKTIILLLCGGLKNTKADQNRDIEKAKKYLYDHRGKK